MRSPQNLNRERVEPLDLLCCPLTGAPLMREGNYLRSAVGDARYPINDNGIPLFAKHFLSGNARTQQQHYDHIAQAYVANLDYPHTKEYMAYLDRMLWDVVDPNRLETIAELCCGHGEALKLMRGRFKRGIGVDVSEAMLDVAVTMHPAPNVFFVQADVIKLPFATNAFDSVFMLGGIHHVNDRLNLFREIHRILKPGGCLYFREPVNDFFLWRWIRAFVYRISPALDHATERPLLREETIPVIEQAGLVCRHYRTHGLIGFCLFMNSDVLVFNRVFRFIPAIGRITRMASRFDAAMLRLPGLQSAGLQVIGVAEKPRGPIL